VETENQTQVMVPRTSAGLRGALFDELDSLRGGKSNAAKANATAKLASAIVATVEMELEVHRTMAKVPKTDQVPASLPPLTLAAA
jgi:hypothetical protein